MAALEAHATPDAARLTFRMIEEGPCGSLLSLLSAGNLQPPVPPQGQHRPVLEAGQTAAQYDGIMAILPMHRRPKGRRPGGAGKQPPQPLGRTPDDGLRDAQPILRAIEVCRVHRN